MKLIALGANLSSDWGTPVDTMAKAIALMPEYGIDVLSESQVWVSAPVPMSDQPWYHNAVISVQTDLSAFAVLEALQDIEVKLGRIRTIRNASRTLDLDLIAYDDQVLDKPELIVPHPRMDERAFVLYPMNDIAPPYWRHPVSGVTLREMMDVLSNDEQAMPLSQYEQQQKAHG